MYVAGGSLQNSLNNSVSSVADNTKVLYFTEKTVAPFACSVPKRCVQCVQLYTYMYFINELSQMRTMLFDSLYT